MSTKVFLTKKAKQELEDRLKHLKTVGRADMAEKIRTAREYGDLSENAEYDIAKDEQAKMEGEIVDIEAKLQNVEIIEENVRTDTISLGTKVRILDVSLGREDDYSIVGSHESNPMEFKISNESPIGKALMGKKKGDVATVDTTSIGGGKSEFKVIKLL
ncbi:MAG: transcription elongation factor GreA [Firmicutes bacterium]|nr:transcription elongation factor GreA [Bacillota bacterium]